MTVWPVRGQNICSLHRCSFRHLGHHVEKKLPVRTVYRGCTVLHVWEEEEDEDEEEEEEEEGKGDAHFLFSKMTREGGEGSIKEKTTTRDFADFFFWQKNGGWEEGEERDN